MMEKNKTVRGIPRRWIGQGLIILALVLSVGAGAALLYSLVTDRVIGESIQSMEELAFHDEVSIMKSVEYRWDSLAGIGAECRQMKCETIGELLSLLHIKENSLNCLDLALVDENEDVYFGALFISRDENITKMCRTGQERFITRYDGTGQNADTRRECLLFGAKITPFSVEGKVFHYIVCRFHIDELDDELKIYSYSGAGYSSVIDLEGNYIINLNRSHSVQERNNFYSDLESYRLSRGTTVEKVREKVHNRESFTISYKTEDGEELMRFTPMEDVDWYFVMAVSRTVFEAQSMGILQIVFLIFVIIGIAMVMILFLALHSRYIVRQAKLEQAHRDELSEALVMAEQASRAKTTFLNNMSHDIRTPMNAIIGFTNLAISRIDEKEQVKDYLAKISQSSNHLLSLINDVLDMSRIESGKVVIEEKPENLAEILHNIRSIIQTEIHSKQLKLFIDAVNVTDEDILCDRLRLNQVLLNLLSNAMKFTPPGGTVSVQLFQLKSGEPGRGVYELHVKDTGIGMGKEFAATIFEPFTRERTSTVSGIQGTGLGMSITKNIVDMMGGKIEVQSEKGKGTEFIVSLTFNLQEAHKEPERIACLEGFHALVVDDDMDSCQSVSQMLRNLGMRAEWTMYGKEAVARTKEALEIGDQYRVYIIDWLMPDLSGVETARKIRRLVGEDAPIILLSAYDWGDIENDAREAGVSGFVSKPLFHSELHRTLSRFCGDTPKEAKEPEPEAISFEGRRILLVDDNELNREIATEILQDVGFVIETAEDGKEAVDAVKNSAAGYYDAVLMDVQMPIMDGYQASREIRKLPDPALAKTLIIAMTANAFEEDKQAALDAGMDGHVGKPIDVPLLLDILSKFLLE